MIRLIKEYYERSAFVLSAMAFVTGAGWFWRAQAEVRHIKAIPISVRLTKSAYQPADSPAASIKQEPWSKPVAQSTGNGWVYELFTPPVVFYNQLTEAFSVTPPSDSIEAIPAFNLELIAVRRELFRLQLRGYFGEPGSYTVAFAQPGRPGALLAKEGRRFEDLGLTFRHFSVRRIPHARPGEFEMAAWVELFDERAGGVVTLDSRGPNFAAAAIATVKISNSNEEAKEVREGDVVLAGATTYRIDRIQYAPAEVVVTRGGRGLSSIETKTLHPPENDLAGAAIRSTDPVHFPSRPATGLATNVK